MGSWRLALALSCCLFVLAPSTAAQIGSGGTVPVGAALKDAVTKSRLTAPGSTAFHLKATVSPANSYNAQFSAEIEEYWVSPEKWRRTIRSKDFDQTVIVNGRLRFEQNSSGYYPKWLNDIVSALFDVVPSQIVQEIGRVDREVPVPGGPGKYHVGYSPTATDGKVTMSWGGAIDFDNRTGLLEWISGTGFAAGFKEYKLFEGKMVARLIETFPPVPGGDVVTRVTELRELEHADDGLFAISEPTPAGEQVRIVQVPEVEYRKLAISPPVMEWPAVKSRPTSGILTTYIVTDRSGQVRDCKFIISNNMTLADGTCDLVKKWRFKPFLVDGVPAEVETTMTFAYDAELTGSQAKFEAASFYFKHGRDLTYPRTDGSPSFHMKGTFEGRGPLASYRGSYEEIWIGPNRWWRQVTMGNLNAVESRIDDDHYGPVADGAIGDAKSAAVVQRVFSLFGAEFPGYAYFSPDTDWQMTEVKFDNIPVLRVSMGPTEGLGSNEFPRAYYFDEKGLVRARTMSHEAITYSEFVEFAGKEVPRQIDSKVDGARVLGAHIDVLEPTQDRPDKFFVLPAVKPKEWLRPSPW